MYRDAFQKACPIWTKEEGYFHVFRSVFNAHKGKALMRIAGGVTMGRGVQLNVGLNGLEFFYSLEKNLDFDMYYKEILLSDELSEGKNVLALRAAGTANDCFAIEIIQDGRVVCFSGPHFKTRAEKAYTSDAANIKSVNIPNSREEHFDARICLFGWEKTDFDDSSWSFAADCSETCGWKEMHLYEPDMLEVKNVWPQKLCELEAVRQASGDRLAVNPDRWNTVHLYATHLTAAEASTFIIRSQHHRYDRPMISIDGQRVELDQEITLTKGRHYLAVVKQNWLELLFEGAHFTYDAKGMAENCIVAIADFPEYNVHFHWNEEEGILRFRPQMEKLLEPHSSEEVPSEIRARFRAGFEGTTTSVAEARWQHYEQVKGGFYDPSLAPMGKRVQNKKAVIQALHPETLTGENGCFTLLPPGDGLDVQFILDLGNLFLGHVSFTIDAPEGTVFDVHCAEIIDKTGLFFMYNCNSFRYITKGGLQQYTDMIRRGCRYLCVDIRHMTGPVSIQKMKFISLRYPVFQAGEFRTSDERLNRIFELCVNTTLLSMHETYTDCPSWEQTFWTGDCHITATINHLLYGAFEYDQRCIDLIGSTLKNEFKKYYSIFDFTRKDAPRLTAPCMAPGSMFGGIPFWSFQLATHCWEHYMASGSLKDLEKGYSYVCKNLKIAEWWTNDRGLFDMTDAWNLLDWANNDLPPCGEVTGHNMALAENLRIAGNMAEQLGHMEEAQQWRESRKHLVDRINELCWDEERQAYVDTVRDEYAYKRFDAYYVQAGLKRLSYPDYLACSRISEHTNTLALVYDIVPENRKEAVKAIVYRVKDGKYKSGAPRNRTIGTPMPGETRDGIVMLGSPWFLYFTFDALCRTGQHDMALQVIRRDWGDMLDKGACTAFEMFDLSKDPRAATNGWIGLPNWTRSASHGWSTSPAITLIRDILGIKPLKPGYREFMVSPHLCDLTFAKGAVATPYGPIFVKAEKNSDGRCDIHVQAPEECIWLKEES